MPSRLAPDTLFEPEVAKAMTVAFDAAWSCVAGFYWEGDADWAREVLARRILATAQAGEHDSDRLRDDAVAHWAIVPVRQRA